MYKDLKVDYFFAWMTLLSGLCISAVAMYYSVAGLMSIFSAAAIPIMIMGIVLESSKIVATLWLKRYWHETPNLIKSYLLLAIVILMVITSLGTFGYLSKAHSEQSVPSGDIMARVSVFDEQIKTHKENIASAKKSIAQLDMSVDQLMSRTDDKQGARSAVNLRRSQASERTLLNEEISNNQKEIQRLTVERAPVASQLREVEAEVGPIKYIAALMYGDEVASDVLEKAVRAVIILIVVVFDPLAVVLLLSSQYSFQYIREMKSSEKYKKSIMDDEKFKIQQEKLHVKEKEVILEEVKLDQAIERVLDEQIQEEPIELTEKKVEVSVDHEYDTENQINRAKRKSFSSRGLRKRKTPENSS